MGFRKTAGSSVNAALTEKGDGRPRGLDVGGPLKYVSPVSLPQTPGIPPMVYPTQAYVSGFLWRAGALAYVN